MAGKYMRQLKETKYNRAAEQGSTMAGKYTRQLKETKLRQGTA